MVNERIVIFGVILDGLIVRQLTAVWTKTTKRRHMMEVLPFQLFLFTFFIPLDKKIKDCVCLRGTIEALIAEFYKNNWYKCFKCSPVWKEERHQIEKNRWFWTFFFFSFRK